MNDKLEQLSKKYPKIFNTYFECGDGWASLLEDAAKKIEEEIKGYNLKFKPLQIKEKFGTLRFYFNLSQSEPPIPEEEFREINEKVFKIVNEAEALSSSVCERCGQPAQTGRTGGWMNTICNDCREKHNL